MPYIPHTPDDIQAMLDTIGVAQLDDLFSEIPAALRCGQLDDLPPGLPELEISQLMQQRAAQDAGALCFIGAGAYQHHIPAAVWELATRGEYYSAYTPYQAEASQGTLQLLYEYQSMMVNLTAMEASNASLYDGATALAEAVLMAVRANRQHQSKRILMPVAVNPAYRAVVRSIVHNQGIELVPVPYDPASGQTLLDACIAAKGADDFAALVIAQPNFFGVLEEVDALTDWAQAQRALVIAQVNPLALAILEAPGHWGQTGVDIVCGEGQPLGIPLSYGGPYFGFLCCKKVHVRQMPGRIVGRTLDLEGRPGYTLTLQAREQHIRRSKATSNICTNQGLMVTAATIHLALLGASGLERTALACHAQTNELVEKLCAIPGVHLVFSSARFHEAVLRFDTPVAPLLRALAAHNILGGYDLSAHYPELGAAILVCATELRNRADIDKYAEHLRRILVKTGVCPVPPKF